MEEPEITLSEYVQSIKAGAFAFERWWIQQHSKYSDQFPLSIKADDAGVWDECLTIFCEE